MKNWDRVDLLEMVELFAEDNGWISSEDELSTCFDDEIAPSIIRQYGENDTVAMNEAFNDWSDMLCKDGEIHEEQYNTYSYVGKYSD